MKIISEWGGERGGGGKEHENIIGPKEYKQFITSCREPFDGSGNFLSRHNQNPLPPSPLPPLPFPLPPTPPPQAINNDRSVKEYL